MEVGLVPANKVSAQMGVFRCGNPRGEKTQELFSGTISSCSNACIIATALHQ